MRDTERELHFHLELEALARSREDAARRELEARQAFGNVTYYREEVRGMTLLRWIDRIRQDAKYAVRGLARAPGFTATVIVTLALGFGVNAAMYTMLDQVFRRAPEGVVAPGNIRRVYEDQSRPREPGGREAYPHFTYPHYRALMTVAAPVQLAAFSASDSVSIIDGTSHVPARESEVTASYFTILGVRPRLGRFFVGDEDSIETPTPVAVISDAFWRRTFGADAHVLGRSISVDHRPVTIVGVAPEHFAGIDLDLVDIWVPANMHESSITTGLPWYETFHSSFKVIARIDQPNEEPRFAGAGTVALRAVHLQGAAYDSTSKIVFGPITEANGPAKPAEEVTVATRISWIAMIVLIIACANVTNLLLLRASRRGREISVRRALGASQARLYEQVAIESTLLSLLGGAAALVVALWTGHALRRLMLPDVHWATSALDGHTMLFLLGLSLLIGVGAGAAPALHGTRSNLSDSLKAGSREGAYRRSRLRSMLLIVQTALCVLLLSGAGLYLRSLDNVKSISVGYRTDNLTVVTPTFVTAADHSAELAAGVPAAAARLSVLDGVEAVAYAATSPIGGWASQQIRLPDRDSLPAFAPDPRPSYNVVSPNYFRTVGIPILAGRSFDNSDAAGPGGAVIVTKTMAQVFWPGTSALGKCLILGTRSNPCSTVVGIAGDVHRLGIIEQPVQQYFVPLEGADWPPTNLIIRTQPGRADAVDREATRILAQAIPGVDAARVRRMADILEPQLRPWRLGATLFTAFGILALAVAGIGIYSIVAYGVSQRTNEMGIRVALGAQTSDILDLVVGEGVRVLAVGVGLGVATSLLLGRFLASLLFGVSPYDVSTLIGAAASLGALGLIACALPGWRAARVSPVIALRAD
ncbi:MAG TPA: ADOP family duplicated permease [Gemmatimonadaceae bacterium]